MAGAGARRGNGGESGIGDLQRLLRNGCTMVNLAIYLGYGDTPQAKWNQTTYALALFEHFGVVPRREGGPEVLCSKCGQVFGTVGDGGRYGWRFKCPNGHRIDPKTNTFLANARLNDIGGGVFLQIIHSFVENFTVRSCESQVGVAHDTVVAWYRYCRDVASKIAWHDFRQIGGPMDIVEIDGSHLFKRKYHVGRQMVFGGISRTTKKRCAVLIDRHDQEATLLPIIQKFIDGDSYICSDDWCAYGRVADVFAGYGTVNHSVNFLNPPKEEDPFWVPEGRFDPACLDKEFVGPSPVAGAVPFRIHTNSIERAWRDLKKHLSTAKSLELGPAYFGEWMYRRNVLDEVDGGPGARFARFLRDIARAYPGAGRRPMVAELDKCDCHECEPV